MGLNRLLVEGFSLLLFIAMLLFAAWLLIYMIRKEGFLETVLSVALGFVLIILGYFFEPQMEAISKVMFNMGLTLGFVTLVTIGLTLAIRLYKRRGRKIE